MSGGVHSDRPGAPLNELRLLWAGVAAVSAVVLALVVRFGGAFGAAAVPELTEAGAFTKGGLSIAKLAANLTGTATVGWLLVTAVLLPGRAALSAAGQRALRATAMCATGWALSALALVAFSVSDLYGVPVTTGISGNMLRSFLLEMSQGRALLTVTVVAVAVAVGTSFARSAGGAGHLLVLAVAGLMPPVFTGHAAGGGDHALAVFSLAAHIAGAALWVGGLVALVALARPARDLMPDIVPRYSRLALCCFAVVGASGLVNAWVRLGGLHLDSRYAALIVAKTAALAGLGALGWWHRRSSIPALRSGTRVFVRIATVEVLAMAATMALATGLSRTPPPEVPVGTLDPVELRLGFALPGPADPRSYLLEWWFDPLFLVLVLAGGVAYGAGVARLRDRPRSRVVAWYAGLAVVLVATCSGLARYSMVLFSAHVVQHLTLSLIAPALLLYGAHGLLASRTTGGLAQEIAGSRAVRLLTRPAIATAILVASLYGFYFSSFFEGSMRNHAVHSLTMAGFLAAGAGFFSAVIRSRPRVRLVMAGVLVASHAVFGAVFVTSGEVLAARWYAGLGRTWGTPPLHDQHTGGLLVWVVGVAAAVALVPALRRRSPGESP